MKRSASALVVALAIAGVAQAAEYTGVAPSGAWYHIQAPDGWQAGGPVVLYQHGLDFKTPADPPGLGPLRSLMLSEGYAVAATTYRQRGWALFTAVEDNRELLDIVAEKIGAPGEVVPFGGSLGGLVALKVAEADGFPPIKGTYALCPAAAGARIWDTAIDLRLAYDVVCHGAGDLPTGHQPLPWAFDLDDIPNDISNLGDQAAVLGTLVEINQCTGVNLPPLLRNDAMQRRLDELMAFAHLTDEEFFVTNMAYATYAMSDLVRAPDKLDGHNPFTTAGVDYSSDPDIQAGIARIAAEPAAAAEFAAVSNFHGEVGAAKVLSMHTSRDELVVPSNQEFVRNVLPADQITSAIVDEDAPTHCGFTDAEGVAGWEALRAWKDGAPQPDVAELQSICEAAIATGDIDGPCRFDANAAIVPFDSLVRTRGAGTPTPSHGHSTHALPPVLRDAPPPPPRGTPSRMDNPAREN